MKIAVLAATALLLGAGVAHAGVPMPLDAAPSLVINVVDDVTSETDAIELDRNELPSPEGSAEKKEEPMKSEEAASPSPKADETDAIEADENKLPSPEGK